jgi:hypothetical protein
MVVREDVVHVHSHDAYFLAKMTDGLVEHAFANHAAAVTTVFISFAAITMFTFVASLPEQALQALCDVDTNSNQDRTLLSATNDKVFEGTSSNELITACRRRLSRNCG